MTITRIEPLALDGACLVHRAMHGDGRGWFSELWRQQELADAGIDAEFVQDNWARSTRHVLRGLHFQRRTPQGKLITVVAGVVQDVIVDLRPDSATFRRHSTVELGERAGVSLWVPPGFAHGYCVLSDMADVLYKCTAYYDPGHEGGLRWDDPALGIAWRVGEPVVSPRDAAWPLLGGPEEQ